MNNDAIVKECERQEESCLYSAVTLFEYAKSLRLWRFIFVVAPIVLGAFASWQLISQDAEMKWVTGSAALLAGVLPAIYKALDFDVNIESVTKSANAFKALQDRFRQVRTIDHAVETEKLREFLAKLMDGMDTVRAGSPVAPERFFKSAQKKISSGAYVFKADK
jgi:hypothetical protein